MTATVASARMPRDPALAPDAVMARAGGENFPVASRLLPRAQRAHLLAIYGFARLVDQAGDEAAGDRRAALDAIEAELDAVFAGGAPAHPIMARLAPTVDACRLPEEPFRRLIAANRQDQDVSRYATFAELEAYCELSANPVGRLVLAVLTAATPQRVALSDRVCTGLQLAEHWQDVGEDARAGRVYLPVEDLERFGVTAGELGGRAPASPALRRLMAFEVERARSYLAAGVPLARSLRGRARLAVAAFAGGGLAALRAIARADFDVLGGAPTASTALRLRVTAGVLGGRA